MKFADILALAKAGYTPADVKELMALDKDPAPAEEQLDSTGTQKLPGDGEPIQAPEKAKEAESTPDNDKSDADQKPEAIDYKKLYEDSQSALKEAQKANTSQDNSRKDQFDPEKELRDIVASYI